jgi:hypothetical protein
MGSPRDDVVFRRWQCDKENHGWREGPPLTVPCQSFDLLVGPSPSRLINLERKKNTALRCCHQPSHAIQEHEDHISEADAKKARR